MRSLAMLAALALLLGFGSLALAQGESEPAEGPGEEAAPAPKDEEELPLDERKKRYMEGFQRRFSDIQKDDTSPERKEIARLEDLKKDYEVKLTKAESDLDRSKNVVIDSFKKLVQRNKDPEEVETRCESIWIDYLRQSRDNKTAVFEYQRGVHGIDRRINFIRKREVERDLPGLDYQKYYKVDDLEVYGEDEGLDFNVFGRQKSSVSYYELLKDFVLQMSGGGRGDDRIIEKYLEEPPLVRLWKDWRKRADRSSTSD